MNWIMLNSTPSPEFRHNRFGTEDVPVSERFEYSGPAGQISGKKLSIGGFGQTDDGFN